MRTHGINYDTGFFNAGTSTHEPFDPAAVGRDMRVIRTDLHCTAVRITGGDLDRLEIAARHAVAAGLEVWFCPFTNGISQDALLDLLADGAERAERLRQSGAGVVLLTGSELSLFTPGFLPGESLSERLALLADLPRMRTHIGAVRTRLDAFLHRAVERVRARFGGRISYASLPFEGVDWSRFDLVATDAGYRTAATAATFRDSVRASVEAARAQGKAVAVTEFGCAAHHGASELAHRDITGEIVWSPDGRALKPNGTFVRDEKEQADYVRESLEVFEAAGVEAAFVYTFARFDLPYRPDPAFDLDMMSAGVVKVLDREGGASWTPKAAFNTVATFYGSHQTWPRETTIEP